MRLLKSDDDDCLTRATACEKVSFISGNKKVYTRRARLISSASSSASSEYDSDGDMRVLGDVVSDLAKPREVNSETFTGSDNSSGGAADDSGLYAKSESSVSKEIIELKINEVNLFTLEKKTHMCCWFSRYFFFNGFQ